MAVFGFSMYSAGDYPKKSLGIIPKDVLLNPFVGFTSYGINRLVYIDDIWSYNCEPSILDENYVNISIGSSDLRAETTLYQARTDKLYYQYMFNLDDATIGFSINPYYTLSTYNGYFTNTLDLNNSNVWGDVNTEISLINDKYQEWRLYNSANILGTVLTTAISLAAIYFSKGAATAAIASGYKTAQAGAATAKVTGMYTGMMASTAAAGTGSLIKQGIQANVSKNIASVSNVGAFTTAMEFGRLEISLDTKEVPDIKEVAFQYHKFGNKMYLFSDNIKNMFNRQQFDYVQTSDIDLYIDTYTNDDFIINDIKRNKREGIAIYI